MSKKKKAKRGRPSKYSKALASRICSELRVGRTLRDVCRDEDMPAPSTVLDWKDKHEGFSEQYAQARERGYQAMAEEILEIADDGTNDWVERETQHGKKIVFDSEHFQRSRLRFDARRWLLSKALPKLYGDKLALTDPAGGPLVVQVVNYADSPNP